ncbi:MAG: efflux RND transporter periplasmic adaptor subunit [Hyphomicrobiales bacterium]|jgi:Cu(I)/Ag(I) efflux system membrane fusion protein|uniref:efflux RND transporter periplasmic adaptor subunit n=1 Tax=Alteromonas mediterranea TaxID=314275 RepID=UPI000B75A86B|nr:efflux transporter periplasmic adaptor subunit [Rhodobiaceae bacterium]MBL6735201.1 efflux RND transporter periplasmic adaptor subunit [Shewanellaceae bacterium]MBR9897041.1 efflux RND transporter periplasmic adaptor subunit [Gammaproteobacteria bacterium]MEA3380572.1 efflux RND transporter periplasmic adaptor subunit [Pseudomonadota bacterium]OUV05266.1 MAG: efflux transporter periplasmic adaptor subunit [Cellvibrionales bacterium TMED79]|tara:strand:- start:4644 stop:6398 length:1755 start_codon:yes stop_codon:yes gene_type:complete
MSSNTKIIIAIIIGAAIGAGTLGLFLNPNSEGPKTNSEEKKPLYWVAPMDSNYRRDKPGKSPMGMDLIPVYEDESSTDDFGPGAVRVAPHVVNNLGVRTAPVELENMHTEISTVGYVQYDEDKLIHIHPRVDGWIEKLYVKAEGDPVEKGQPLYSLYSPQLVNAQEELLIALKRNNGSLVTAAKDRLKALQLSAGLIKELEQTKKVQQTITFYSPQAGVVDGLKIREGFYVKPGDTLLSIGKLDQVWVEAEVFERDAALIKEGLPVSMTLDYLPGEDWTGVVDYVYPALNSKTRTLRVRLKFGNPDFQLKPNMFAQVSIHANQADSAIIVPKEAVIRTGKQDRVVLALGDGQFKSIEVTIGRVDKDSIEILSGLNEDDVVVTSAQFLIDSESSKSSDFKRMTHDEVPNSIWMQGEVNSVMTGHRMVNITHGPAEAWDWPEMTMDFNVAENVDVDSLKSGQSLHFEVSKTEDSGYEVTGIHIMSQPEVSSATVSGLINEITLGNRTFNISRGPIEKWDRPAATMDFIVAENIEIADFNVGDNVTFTFEVRDELVITEISLEANEKNSDEHETNHEQKAVVDHSNH